mgnify:CR=1 FL=1
MVDTPEAISADILIVEGLNVLQPAKPPSNGDAVPFVSDFFDFSVYIDADEADIERWYMERFTRLRETAFQDPASYFHRYAAVGAADRAMRPGSRQLRGCRCGGGASRWRRRHR